jgi:protein phosphatase
MVRAINEDSYCIIPGSIDGVPLSFVIADGMGGHNAGEVASRMAAEMARKFILKFQDLLAEEILTENLSKLNVSNIDLSSMNLTSKDLVYIGIIKKIVNHINFETFAKSKENDTNSGMGTTLVLSLIIENKLYIGHIGDSRAYLFRNNEMQRLTEDHSYIQELIKNGTLTLEEAQTHPKKNQITRAVGCFDTVETDIYMYDLEYNDVLIFCTDGLTNMICEEELGRLISRADDLDLLCEEFITIANERGGEDNITVIAYKND